MAKAICAIEGCPRPHHARGWCRMHWRRWQRTGDPTKTRKLYRLESEICIAKGCEVVAVKKNLCNTHYWKLWLYGDPDKPVPSQRGPANNNWKGVNIPYATAHSRVGHVFGPAKDYDCADCGEPADEWSYNNAADIEIIDERGRRYSGDPRDYAPRCRPCHARFDKAAARKRREALQ